MIDVGGLYAEYAPHVYRFALYLSGNREVAEDLTSETFIRLWTASDVRVATVKAYLLAICRNLYIQERRRGRVEPLDPARPYSEGSASGPGYARRGQGRTAGRASAAARPSGTR